MITLPDIKPIERVDIDDGSTADYDGWFCIKLDRKGAKCAYCGRPVEYIHEDTNGRIVVWPEKDHEEILSMAGYIMDKFPHLDPRIKEYEKSMGPAISYEECV